MSKINAFRIEDYVSDGPGFAKTITYLLNGAQMRAVMEGEDGLRYVYALELREHPTCVASLAAAAPIDLPEIWSCLSPDDRDFWTDWGDLEVERAFIITEADDTKWMLLVGGQAMSFIFKKMKHCREHEDGGGYEFTSEHEEAADMPLEGLCTSAPVGGTVETTSFSGTPVRAISVVYRDPLSGDHLSAVVGSSNYERHKVSKVPKVLDGICYPWR